MTSPIRFMSIRSFLALIVMLLLALPALAVELPRPDGKPADMTKPVKVYILLGQSNMVGAGKVGPADKDGSLEHAVKTKKKYPYLIDDAGKWTERKDVRNVRVMASGNGAAKEFNNEWMTVKGGSIGPELGIGHQLGNAIDAPVMILKSCIGNRSLGWDLLPPGSKRYEFEGKVYAGYGEKPDAWPIDPAKGLATEPPLPWLDKNGKPINWQAGLQYDGDIAGAKKVLASLDKYYPDAKGHEIAGFFFWQGDKDRYNAGHASRYEHNLVQFIEQLRKEFDAPNAKFVCATLGQTAKDNVTGNDGLIFNAQMAVDGETGKYKQFKGNVATVYTHPLSLGGASNSHYNGNAETYMNVGEAMGQAMVKLHNSTGK